MSEPLKREPSLVDDRKTKATSEWYLRLLPLLETVKLAHGPPLFVSRTGPASRMTIDQFDGGRDAQYFLVRQKIADCGNALRYMTDFSPPRETISFLPQVAGTAIIYDLTDETLQGKARPFVCDLTSVRGRVYALLPMQIEAIALTAATTLAERTAHIEFHDACGERLQALLPFHFRIEADGKEIKAGYYVTESDGQFEFPPMVLADLPAKCRLTVRSQLTGRAQSIDL
jgi:hypothetical protein